MLNNFVNNADGLRDIVTQVVKKAISQGADSAEAFAEESHGLEVSVRCQAMESTDIHHQQKLSLTVYVKGGKGSASIPQFTPELIQQAVDKALVIARAVACDEFSGLADCSWLATEIHDLDIYHPWDISPEMAIDLAKRSEHASWAVDSRICQEKSGGASVSSVASLSAYANSHNFCAADWQTSHTIACSALAQGDDGAMETDQWSETFANPNRLPKPEKIGERAGYDAACRIGSRPIRNGQMAVLFKAPASHSLIGHFISAASGGALYRKTSWLLDQLGKQIFANHIRIFEYPHLCGELASAYCDGEGVATYDREVVSDGIWRGRFLSSYSARRLSTCSTGHASGIHNMEISGNSQKEKQLLLMLGSGLLVTDLMGQGVNPVTGDYSRGCAGFWVENGEIIHPVSEVTIAGNLPTMLKSIVAVSSDSIKRGAINCGSILLPEMTVSNS